jgi:predicted acyltransferase
MAFFEAEGVMLPASNAKVLLIAFDLIMLAFNIPTAFLGGVGEGGEYALRLDGIAALNDKRVMNYGLLFHGLLSSKGNC